MAAGTPIPVTSVVNSDDCCPPGPGLIPRSEADQIAVLFKALADPVRLQLLRHIIDAEHGTTCACHLPESLGISQPTLSHHLKRLTDAGVIVREQRGRWAHYTVEPSALAQVSSFLGPQPDASSGGPRTA